MNMTAINRGQIEREIQNARDGVERVVLRQSVKWLGKEFSHKKLAELEGQTVVIVPSRKDPENKVKVYYDGVKICKVKSATLVKLPILDEACLIVAKQKRIEAQKKRLDDKIKELSAIHATVSTDE